MPDPKEEEDSPPEALELLRAADAGLVVAASCKGKSSLAQLGKLFTTEDDGGSKQNESSSVDTPPIEKMNDI